MLRVCQVHEVFKELSTDLHHPSLVKFARYTFTTPPSSTFTMPPSSSSLISFDLHHASLVKFARYTFISLSHSLTPSLSPSPPLCSIHYAQALPDVDVTTELPMVVLYRQGNIVDQVRGWGCGVL